MIGTKSEQREAKGKVLALGLVVALMAAFLLLTATPAHAKTFTVNTNADRADQKPGDGKCYTGQNLALVRPECTLRAAIEEANKLAGADTIAFNIISFMGSGLQTISVPPNSPLPPIAKPLTINGYTQPGASKNTLAQGTNAAPKIELRGPGTDSSIVGFMEGLDINAPNVVVKGLVINNFSSDGIDISGAGAMIEGNFLGTDPLGTSDQGNNSNGVNISSTSNATIGGTTPEARNLIAGNRINGVNISDSAGTKVQGNLIGTKDGEDGNLGNGFLGVRIGGSGNTVGGTDVDPTDSNDPANTIAFNGGDGVSVSFGTGNRILGNSIFFNAGLGIDLAPDGVTANDTVPKDPDTGPNRLQNYPVLFVAETTTSPTSGVKTTIEGELNSTPSTRKKKNAFTIQFYSGSQTEADPSGFGEGKTYLGQVVVRTNRGGNAFFAFTVNQDLVEQRMTATATSNRTGDTSEFSKAVKGAFPPN